MNKWLKIDEPLDRGRYFIAGLLLFAIKHNLDRLVASVYNQPFGIFSYWTPIQAAIGLQSVSPNDRNFLLCLILLSIPFVGAGIVLTLRRLRALHLPGWLVILFFVPVANLLLFAALSLLPSPPQGRPRDERPQMLRRFIPESIWGSAALSLLFTVPIGLACVALGSIAVGKYGWGIFVAIPFSVGLGAALVFGYHQARSLAGSVGVALAANAILGGLIFAVALEGAICLLMALPIALFFGFLGGVVGYHLQRRPRKQAPAMLALVFLFSPGVITTEWLFPRDTPLLKVVSSIEVTAPPERVWEQVVSFSELPPPQEAIFRAGIAYPVRARIDGSGPGAIRRCEFSTGPFIEPIEIWDEPRLLRFSVTANPQPMQEWTPYQHVEPRHLDGYLVSRQGQFRLVQLPNGRTLLEGTTWYQLHLWPARYWQVWSDAIIHRIHLRVLRHVKALSENL
ncbi:MAG TPA: hypothetical protein VEU96_27495 [Bryobacteraceae bacterium]|nr:hypothetical protein [Bryobacteraceae bacterium]